MLKIDISFDKVKPEYFPDIEDIEQILSKRKFLNVIDVEDFYERSGKLMNDGFRQQDADILAYQYILHKRLNYN